MATKLIEKLLALKPQGCSVEEIAHRLKEPVDKVRSLLIGGSSLPGNYQLVKWMNHLGAENYQLLPPEEPEPTVHHRAFRFLRSKDESYHRVFIQDDVTDINGKPAKCIELFPFSDVHFGHKRCDESNFMRDIKEVEKRPNRLAFLNGDVMENALGDSAGGAAWAEQRLTPHEQYKELINILRPIAHKIVVARPGNHEQRTEKKGLINPLEVVCDHLRIPYFAGPSNMEIVWRGYRWTFFIKHGTSGSNTPGGKLNSVGKERAYNDFRNFHIMGHVHDEMTHKVTRALPRREFDGQNLKRFWIEYPKEYKVICPSYLLYSGTYAESAGYSPGSRNVIVIQLFNNGDYHVVSSKRRQDSDNEENSII